MVQSSQSDEHIGTIADWFPRRKDRKTRKLSIPWNNILLLVLFIGLIYCSVMLYLMNNSLNSLASAVDSNQRDNNESLSSLQDKASSIQADTDKLYNDSVLTPITLK